MPTSYLYIDDEAAEVLPLVERVQRAFPGLVISHVHPQEFDAQVRSISQSGASGLILDLRLDELPGPGGQRMGYRALALAQELRTRMTERVLASMPIVLWSADAKMKSSYENDSTGHDLLDATYRKNQVTRESERVARELVALAVGYREIADRCDAGNGDVLTEILHLSGADADALDPRVGGRLRSSGGPAHDFARVVLRDLVDLPGPLIDEQIVAFRLGVAIASPGWAGLRKSVQEAAMYDGVFSDGWPRYWAFRLQSWWDDKVSARGNLRSLAAEQRVELLSEAGFSELSPAVGEKGKSRAYWTACVATNEPLDPVDGILVDVPQAQAWHDGSFMTVSAVVDRSAAHKGFHVHPLERERIAELLDDGPE